VSDDDGDVLVPRLAALEYGAAVKMPIVAIRGSRAWQPAFQPILPDETLTDTTRVREGGVYVILGGTGRIGGVLVEEIGTAAPCHLILTGRQMPPDDLGDSPRWLRLADAIAKVEAVGSTVTVEVLDLSEHGALTALMARVRATHGSVTGVVHSAGVTGGAAHRVVEETTRSVITAHADPKIAGVEELKVALADDTPDFVVLCSSIAAQLGGVGFAAYAAANAYLDATAIAQARQGRPWISLAWDGWDFDDVALRAGTLGRELRTNALQPDEGPSVWRRVLVLGEPLTFVSTTDLPTRWHRWAEGSSAAEVPRERRERPQLATTFEPPSGQREVTVAQVWGALLGISEIGVHDNFFELGGDSLLGLQVVHRLRAETGHHVPLAVVYEGPTVRTLAALLPEADQEDPVVESGPCRGRRDAAGAADQVRTIRADQSDGATRSMESG